MTSFGWKRKAVVSSKPGLPAFQAEEQEDQREEVGGAGVTLLEPVTETFLNLGYFVIKVDCEFDWISVAKRRRVAALEDNKALVERLSREGTALAEQGKFWQAINRWDNALSLNPKLAAVLEMKAQALVSVYCSSYLVSLCLL